MIIEYFMIKRVNSLEKLGKIINSGKSDKMIYDLGKGEERTEILVTYIDGNTRVSDRIDSSPLVQLSQTEEGISMDISDSNENSDGYSYKNLKPSNAIYEQPTHSPYELGDLVINLERNKQLAISQYQRAE